MATNLEELKKQLKALTALQKAAVARALIEELDELTDQDAEQLWEVEAERRYVEYRAGRLEAKPGDEVMRQVRKRLK